MNFLKSIPHLFVILILISCSVRDTKTSKEALNINVDLAKKKGAINHAWAMFGYDEPNYTYMKDGKKLLTEIAELSPVPVYVRTHNLLTSGDGTPALKWGSTNI